MVYPGPSKKTPLLLLFAAQHPAQPVLGIRFTDSHCLAAATNEHGKRANCANDESRWANHSKDQIHGTVSGALYQVFERIRGRGILGDRIGNDVHKDEKNKAKNRCQEEECELPCSSPGMGKSKDKGRCRKKG